MSAWARQLRDKDEATQREAVRALAAIGPDAGATVPELVALLTTAEPDVQDAVILALEKIEPTPAVRAGIHADALRGQHSGRLKVLRALKGSGRDAAPAVPALVALLDDKDAAVRAATMDVLAAVGPGAAAAKAKLIEVRVSCETPGTSHTLGDDRRALAAIKAIDPGYTLEVRLAAAAKRAKTGVGELRGDRITVAARVEGIVKEVLVTRGQDVKTGDILIKLDDPLIAYEVERAEADLTAARKGEAEARAMLVKDRPDSEMLLAMAVAHVKAAEEQLANARLKLQYCEVRAPASGRVAQVDVHRGERLGGLSNGDLKLALSGNRPRVSVEMWGDSAATIRVGQPCQIKVTGHADFKGRAKHVSADADGRVYVDVEFDSDVRAARLTDGAKCEVAFPPE